MMMTKKITMTLIFNWKGKANAFLMVFMTHSKSKRGLEGCKLTTTFSRKRNPNGVLMIFMSHAVSKRDYEGCKLAFQEGSGGQKCAHV